MILIFDNDDDEVSKNSCSLLRKIVYQKCPKYMTSSVKYTQSTSLGGIIFLLSVIIC